MGVEIETISPGDGRTFPKKGQTCVVHYTDKQELNTGGRGWIHYGLTLKEGQPVSQYFLKYLHPEVEKNNT